MLIYSILVKATIGKTEPADVVELAKKKLGGLAVVNGTERRLSDHEVKVLVQCPNADLQAWFAEDLGQDPPFRDGSLLLWSPWTKEHAHAIEKATKTCRDCGRRIVIDRMAGKPYEARDHCIGTNVCLRQAPADGGSYIAANVR